MRQARLFYPRQICVPFLGLSRGSLQNYLSWTAGPWPPSVNAISSVVEERVMANQRRQFLGLAAGAIAVPATSSLVVAQGEPSRGKAPTPAQASVPERQSRRSELT